MRTLTLQLALIVMAIGSFISSANAAQKHFFEMKINVKDDSSKHILSDVVVNVSTADGASYAYPAKDGKVEVQLELGEFVYDLKIARAGYVPKTLRFDVRNIPDQEKTSGFDVVIDMGLFRFVQGFDLTIMNAPCGINKYDAAMRDLLWDVAYTKEKQAIYKKEIERAKSSSMQPSFEKFDKAYEVGTKYFERKEWLSAMAEFEKAAALLPGEPMTAEKVKACSAALDEEIAAHASANRGQSLIELGDRAMELKEYIVAKKAYQAAAQLDPRDKYPKERLFEIGELLKKLVP